MSDKRILVSVIMPVFNAEEYLEQSLRSVCQQSFNQFELIIVNDGSSDNSEKILQRWQALDSRIKLIRHATNQGVSASRNTAINAVQCSQIALVDADDIWHSDKLKIQFEHHQRTQCAFSCTAFSMGNKTIKASSLITYQDLLANNVVNTSSVMFDAKQLHIQFQNLDKSEDYQQWLSVAKQHDIHFINQALVNRSAFGGASSDKLKMAKQRWRIYRQSEQLSLVTSAYYFVRYAITGIQKYWRIKH